MAKRNPKNRRQITKIGLGRNNICPYCARPVQLTRFVPQGHGHAVTHWWGPGVCAFIPNAQIMEVLEQGVRDVIGEVSIEAVGDDEYRSSGHIDKYLFAAALQRVIPDLKGALEDIKHDYAVGQGEADGGIKITRYIMKTEEMETE